MINTIEIQDTNMSSTKKAIIHQDSNGYNVVFGRVISDEFRPSHHKSSRTYKTAKGAHNAAINWVYR